MTAMNEEAMQISDVSGLWMMDGGRMHVAFQKDAPGSATIEMRADQQCVVTVQEDGRLLARFVSIRPANEEAMRAAFESNYHSKLIERVGDGYLDTDIDCAWPEFKRAWQAAIAAQSAEVEQLRKELADLKDDHEYVMQSRNEYAAENDELRAQVEAMRKALQKVGDTAVYVDHGECSVSMDVIREVDAALAAKPPQGEMPSGMGVPDLTTAINVLRAVCDGRFDKPGHPSYVEAHKALAELVAAPAPAESAKGVPVRPIPPWAITDYFATALAAPAEASEPKDDAWDRNAEAITREVFGAGSGINKAARTIDEIFDEQQAEQPPTAKATSGSGAEPVLRQFVEQCLADSLPLVERAYNETPSAGLCVALGNALQEWSKVRRLLDAHPPAAAPVESLLGQWESRAKSALPADAMLINKHIRELRAALARAGKAES